MAEKIETREDAKRCLEHILDFDLDCLDMKDNQDFDLWCAYSNVIWKYKEEGEEATINSLLGGWWF